jgi:hypothetical protein
MKVGKVMKINKRTITSSRLPILLALVLLSVFLSACKEKNEGTFVGQVKMRDNTFNAEGNYANPEVKVDNVTLILAPSPGKDSLSYLLSFDEKSPIKCSLEVTDEDWEDEYVMGVQLNGDSTQTCEVRDEKGNVQTAKVTNVSSRLLTYEKSTGSLSIDLQGVKSGRYKFEFEGVRK